MMNKSSPPTNRIIGISTPSAMPGQRIGIMGGSFNPPHEGHRIVARTAMRQLRLDALWWLVTPGNPLKNNDDLLTLEERMHAIGKMTMDPRMKITAFEEDLRTPYTAATLAFLKLRYPATHFAWVMGADNLASFDRWQQWRDIAKAMPIAVVDRPGFHLPALASKAARTLAGARIPQAGAAGIFKRKVPAWTFLTTRLSHLSSTELRRQ